LSDLTFYLFPLSDSVEGGIATLIFEFYFVFLSRVYITRKDFILFDKLTFKD